jgi:hypothetical protein
LVIVAHLLFFQPTYAFVERDDHAGGHHGRAANHLGQQVAQ